MSVDPEYVKKLEEEVARLRLAVNGQGEGKSSAAVSDFDDYVARFVEPFVATCNKVDGTKKIGDGAQTAFTTLRKVIVATSECKKPTDKQLMAFVDPIVQVVNNAQKTDNRSAFFSHEKAWAETSQIMNWLFTPGPAAHVSGCVEAAEFYLNKILMGAKSESDAGKQQAFRDYVAQTKSMINELAEYIKRHFKMGLSWKANGADIGNWQPGQASAAAPPAAAAPPGGAVPPPPPSINLAALADDKPAAAAPAAGASAGMAAVFNQLNKGDSVTSGLKKVTSDMKTKNMKDVPALQPKAAAAPAAPAVAAAAKKEEKKPQSLGLRQGTWFVEYYENQDVEIPDVEMKHTVYILKANNSTIRINGKCKSIQADGCNKTRIIFNSVVSTFEVVNCKRMSVTIEESCPSVALDKTSGCQIILTEKSVKESPNIFTSSTSEINLVVPGAKPEDDPIELPMPEQYLNTFKNGKIHTEPVKHSGA